MKPYKSLFEKQTDIKVGDVVLGGKFKNKQMTVKGFDTDENNQPVIVTDKGKTPLYKVRIKKLMPEEAVIEEHFRLVEELRMVDLMKHAGISNFTKFWRRERNKLKGAESNQAKLVQVRINKKYGYVDFIFLTAGTYTNDVTETLPKRDFALKGGVNDYSMIIRVLDFFKWAQTTPGYKAAKKLSPDELKEIFYAANIKVWCSCPSMHWQGFNYYLSLFDASIFPTEIAPTDKKTRNGKTIGWKSRHNAGDGLVCKHLSGLLAGIKFWWNPMSSTLNKALQKL